MSLPVAEALRLALIDVPLFLQTAQCEMDPANATVDALRSRAAYAAFLSTYLQSIGFNSSVALVLLSLYSDKLMVDVELGFETWLADLGVTCGTDHLAELAGMSFISPVYRSHLVAAPSHLFVGRKRYAFHSWDFPTAGVGFWSHWKPEESDLNLGAALRATWNEMLLHPQNVTGFATRLRPREGSYPLATAVHDAQACAR